MNIAIVDSSLSDAERLIEYISKYLTHDSIAFNCVHFDDGIKFLESDVLFDIVFMETELPYRNGFSVAEAMRGSDKYISLVFYTSNREDAIKGYDLEAVDYLLKPLEYDDFSVHFKHILKRSRIDTAADEGNILIKTKKKIVNVRLDNIVFVEVNGHSCVYHLVDNEIKVTDRLFRVAQILSAHNFEYCNTCYLVNLKHVNRIEDGYAYVGAASLKISRGKSKIFLDKLTEYLTKK